MPRRRMSGSGVNAAVLTSADKLRQSSAYVISMIMVAITLWMLTNFVGQLLTSAQLERRIQELQTDITQLEAEKRSLEQQVAYTESSAYAEQVAREQLGLAREGDVVILPTFPDTSPEAQVEAPQALPQPTTLPNWQAWKQALTQSGSSGSP